MISTFDFYTDPGHGWLKVPRGLLSALGIEHLISPYSYATATHVYLEEDCDMSVFFKAFEDTYGKKPQIIEHYTNGNARCTNLPHYNHPGWTSEGYLTYLGYKVHGADE